MPGFDSFFDLVLACSVAQELRRRFLPSQAFCFGVEVHDAAERTICQRDSLRIIGHDDPVRESIENPLTFSLSILADCLFKTLVQAPGLIGGRAATEPRDSSRPQVLWIPEPAPCLRSSTSEDESDTMQLLLHVADGSQASMADEEPDRKESHGYRQCQGNRE